MKANRDKARRLDWSGRHSRAVGGVAFLRSGWLAGGFGKGRMGLVLKAAESGFLLMEKVVCINVLEWEKLGRISRTQRAYLEKRRVRMVLQGGRIAY